MTFCSVGFPQNPHILGTQQASARSRLESLAAALFPRMAMRGRSHSPQAQTPLGLPSGRTNS
jgi:hypothetical protein